MPRKRTSIPTYRAQSRQQHVARKLGYLAEIDIFQDLSPEEMDWMARITTMTTCPKGRVFYRPEETGEVLFLLKRGRVQIYRISPEGKKLVVTVIDQNESHITVDGNHPLAGMYLNFDVEVKDIRDASTEELEHQHVHGPGGHQH
jgi:CRP-like cAMP-binding protein